MSGGDAVRPRLLDRADLAEALSISVAAVQRLEREGRIPTIRITERTVRFDLERVVEALVRSNGPASESGA